MSTTSFILLTTILRFQCFKLLFCTVGGPRSNGLVEKLEHTVEIETFTMAQEHQKPTLQHAVSKFIGNLRSSFQSKIKCLHFEIRFNRKPDTIRWKFEQWKINPNQKRGS